MMRIILLSLFLCIGFVYSISTRKLTIPAAATGVTLALFVYLGAGFTGFGMMALFFIVGSAATSWQLTWKKQQGLAENDKGIRMPLQVVANAGIPAIIGFISFLFASKEAGWLGHRVFPLMIAAAFASAAADTLSSELGNIYGRRYYNILNFKKDQRGLNGVISLEGTLLGLVGSILIAFVYPIGFGWEPHLVLIIILAGTIGNISDSLLGATLERQKWIGNNTVNFLNTLVAALSALLLLDLFLFL